jgi:cellulose biosynthesis protein BcsQ
MSILRFDSILETIDRALNESLKSPRTEITIIRDTVGKPVVILPDSALEENTDWDILADKLDNILGVYSLGKRRVLLRQSDLIDADDILQSPDRIRLPDMPNTWLIDRLQTNQDWLRAPLVKQPPLPTAVAFSIKGGVGRTTAFALWAWYLARQGKNIVLVDLDLEAPGVAGVLLDEDHMPDYGLVDWLVEALVGQPDNLLLRDSLVECALSSDEPGRIRVLPAFGKKTSEYINKLGRIYMPTFSTETGRFSGLAERLLMLLEQLANLPDRPDAVLLDARAGLHDIGSAAVTRLGTEVFLFARDDYQSWQAYQHLFEHLNTARSVVWGMPESEDLRWHLRMVAAQIEPTEGAKTRFIERSYDTWLTLYDTENDGGDDNKSSTTPQLFSPGDEGPHYPLLIQFDLRVKNLDLINQENRPEWRMIETAFGDFFSGATVRLLPDDLLSRAS